MQGTFSVGDTTLFYNTTFRAVLVQNIKQLHRLPVQIGRDQMTVPVIDKFQGKEVLPFIHQPEKNLVPLPEIQFPDIIDIHPFQHTLIAVCRLSGKAVGGKQMHIFCHTIPGNKSHNGPEPIVGQRIACLFPDLPEQAFLRAFIRLKMSTDTDPFVFVYIIFLNDTVQHQIFVILLDVAKRTHVCSHLSTSCLLHSILPKPYIVFSACVFIMFHYITISVSTLTKKITSTTSITGRTQEAPPFSKCFAPR